MMNPRTSVSAIALLLASASAAAAFPATSTTNLNVRSGPGSGYPVVDTLQPGQTVEVTARNGSWYQIGGQGWANGNYLDARSGPTTSYIAPSYGYGPVAFYYDEDPYYYDNAGFYFFVRDGRRQRVGWDWFDLHDHRDFRWANPRYRTDFERRRGGGPHEVRRGDGPRRGYGPSVLGQDQRSPYGDLDRNGELRRGERVGADANVRGRPVLRSGRAAAEGGAGLETGADVRGPRPNVGSDGRGSLRSGGSNRNAAPAEGGIDMRRIPAGGY